jgi:hypothetical protein
MRLEQKLHLERLARQIGGLMNSEDQNETKEERGGILINFHAPCEKVFTNGDYIEVNINFNDGVERDAASISQLVAGAVQGVTSARSAHPRK